MNQSLNNSINNKVNQRIPDPTQVSDNLSIKLKQIPNRDQDISEHQVLSNENSMQLHTSPERRSNNPELSRNSDMFRRVGAAQILSNDNSSFTSPVRDSIGAATRPNHHSLSPDEQI